MDNKTVKVSDLPGYVRDIETGAVYLKDVKVAGNKYEIEKQKRLIEMRKMRALENEVSFLRNEIEEIKRLLKNNNK